MNTDGYGWGTNWSCRLSVRAVRSMGGIELSVLFNLQPGTCNLELVFSFPPAKDGEAEPAEETVNVCKARLGQPVQLVCNRCTAVDPHALDGSSDFGFRASKLTGAVQVSCFEELLQPGTAARYLLGVDKNASRRKHLENTGIQCPLLLIGEMMNCQGRNNPVERAARQIVGQLAYQDLWLGAGEAVLRFIEHFA